MGGAVQRRRIGATAKGVLYCRGIRQRGEAMISPIDPERLLLEALPVHSLLRMVTSVSLRFEAYHAEDAIEHGRPRRSRGSDHLEVSRAWDCDHVD